MGHAANTPSPTIRRFIGQTRRCRKGYSTQMESRQGNNRHTQTNKRTTTNKSETKNWDLTPDVTKSQKMFFGIITF